MNYSVSSKFVKDSFVLILKIDGQVKQEVITPLDEMGMTMVIDQLNIFLEDNVSETSADISFIQEDDALLGYLIDEDGSVQSFTEWYEDYIDIQEDYDEEEQDTKPVRKTSDSL